MIKRTICILLFLLAIKFCVAQNIGTPKIGTFEILKPDTIGYCYGSWDQNSGKYSCSLPILQKTYYKDINKYISHKLPVKIKKYLRNNICTDEAVQFLVDTKGNVASIHVPVCEYKYEDDVKNILSQTKWLPGKKDGHVVCVKMCCSIYTPNLIGRLYGWFYYTFNK